MKSFHGSQEIKDKYLSRVRAHREAGNIIKRVGWENGKGCAVGCTLENYQPERYPIELGLPTWLAYLKNRILENLPHEEAMLWPERLLESIPVGVDVENVKHQIAIERMNRLIEIQKKNPIDKQFKLKVLSVLSLVRECHELELNKNHCDWDSAAHSARSAAHSAHFAAHSVHLRSYLVQYSSTHKIRYAYLDANLASSSAAYAASSAAYSASSAEYSVHYVAYDSYPDPHRAAADSALTAAESASDSESYTDYASAHSLTASAWEKEADILIKYLKQAT